eukprot:TRINITY_DN5510_c0_g1_i1.p1 TRINITY_DN5510_c0_g1~~TRINITY_DN5510_c0_g1_i1.p1  ORF type:complete len:77 (-),score=6.75 TRINITY_DN5510_c0_g1_i1:157-387(-)
MKNNCPHIKIGCLATFPFFVAEVKVSLQTLGQIFSPKETENMFVFSRQSPNQYNATITLGIQALAGGQRCVISRKI